MSFLYCAFSAELNRQSAREYQQCGVYKFGHTSNIATIPKRLNDGALDETSNRRSEPLALCTDWALIDHWHSTRAGRAADDRICKFLSKYAALPRIAANIEHKVRKHDPRANLNGLSEIFLIDRSSVPYLRDMIRQRRLQDPVSVQALTEILAVVEAPA